MRTQPPATEPRHRRRIGREVELAAWEWWRKSREEAGFKLSLLRHGFTCKQGEIDLIAEEFDGRGFTLVLIEVRSRTGSADLRMGRGIEAVDPAKIRKLQKTANYFLWGYRGQANQVRWDLIFFDGIRFQYFEDAWR